VFSIIRKSISGGQYHIPLERTAQIFEYLQNFRGFAAESVRRAFRVRSSLDRGDQYEQAYAGDMADLLLEIKEEVEKIKPDRDSFKPDEIGNSERRYDEIVN